MFKHTQHVEEEMRPTKIHNQQNWRKNGSSDGRDPHGRARKIDLMKDDRAACDYGRHPGKSAEKEIKRNLPGPDGRFDHGLSVVAGFVRNRAAGDIDAFAWNNAFFPSFFAKLF